MANWYVNSAAGGTSAGTSWTNACTSLSQLLGLGTPPAAGDSIFIANTSAESYSSSTVLTFPGTLTAPNFIYSVDTTNQPPTSSDLLAGASVTTTGNTTLTINGFFYCYGVTFSGATGANAPSGAVFLANGQYVQKYDTCSVQCGGTGTDGSAIQVAGAGFSNVELVNTTLKFGSTGQGIRMAGGSGSTVVWKNTASAILGSAPTTLQNSQNSGSTLLMEGVDLSAITGTIVAALSDSGKTVYLKDCKLANGVTVAAIPTQPYDTVFNIRSDSAATNYRYEQYNYFGTETTETSITRVGGATDGTTAQSRKFVSTSHPSWVRPFQGLPLRIWNPFSSGTHTVTIYGTWNNASVPNNDQIWCDVEYLGTSGNPLGSFATATKANNLASGVSLTSDGSTWNGGGSGAGWSPFSMSITFTPTEVGYLYVYPKVADPSSTFYLDPQPVVA